MVHVMMQMQMVFVMNEDDCVGEYDECGVCNGDGIADGACDCDGNVLDDCGVCGGNGTDADGWYL